MTATRTSYGPGFGWVSKQDVGIYVDGTYYFSSQLATTSTTYKGSGFQLEFGVKVALAKIDLLAGVAYESFTYTKDSNGSLSPSVQVSNIDPRLGLQFTF